LNLKHFQNVAPTVRKRNRYASEWMVRNRQGIPVLEIRCIGESF
jgi:hypothetical protein